MKVNVLNELLKNCETQDDIFAKNRLIKQSVKALSELVLQTELVSGICKLIQIFN